MGEYSVILSQISNNQLEMINMLSNIKSVLEGVFLLFSIYFIYIFVRNLIKG